MTTENSVKAEAIDDVLARIEKGAASASVQKFLSDYICARIWKLTTVLANEQSSDPNALLVMKGQLKEIMLLAQSFRLDVIDAAMATEQLKKAYEAKPQGSAQVRR